MGLLPIVIILGLAGLLLLAASRTPGVFRGTVTGALLIGVPSFLAGYVGPMLITPESNQGPLLGIFITGPLGAAIGAVGGAIVAYRRERRAQAALGALDGSQ